MPDKKILTPHFIEELNVSLTKDEAFLIHLVCLLGISLVFHAYKWYALWPDS